MTISADRRLNRLLVLLLIAAPLIGCRAKDEIRSYKVAKEKEEPAAPLTEPGPPVGTTESTDRMLGAILPAGEQTWYFKVAGPIAAMDANAEKIMEFFQSIRLKAGADKPEWQVPPGWEEQAGSGMRAATILVPAEGKPLDLSVIPLPTTGAPGELMFNVNRWRSQLRLPPVDERGLAAATKTMQVGDATMTIVDERGQFSAGSMTAPFAGGGPFSGPPRQPGSAPAQSTAEQRDEGPPADLPPGHPPIDAGGQTSEAGAAPLAFKVPESWQEQPAAGMRKADFTLKDGERSARVTVIDLLASGPSVANALENVNRWRGEIGLEPIKPEQLDGIVQKIEVDGNAGQFVEMIPDLENPAESRAAEATVAAIVPAGQMVWFFKLRGDRDLVVGQRDNFKSFLESVRFKSAGGVGDGN